MTDLVTIKTKHFLNRTTFGWSPDSEKNPTQSVLSSKKESTPIHVIAKPEVPTDPTINKKQFLKEAFKKSKEGMMTLNLAWMEKLRSTNDPLTEKMVLFWHNHFSCRTMVPFLAQQQNNILRKHALGSFADMLMEVSKDPAMLQFLNNQQNKKDHPNENFAREVMELFTLGRGHYTEEDIKEAARAFTGWGFSQGEFQFREKQHDGGNKTFRGQTKKYYGEDIIHIILEDLQTAQFITRKIVAYFVGQEKLSDAEIDNFARSFFKSNYDIGKLVKDILSSDWFYNSKFAGNRIKPPVELIVGIQKHTSGKFADQQSLIFLQRALSQLLFYPPNVGGWPKGKEWIDSSSLAFRMAMPQLVFHKQESEFQAKEDGDVNSLREKKVKRNFSLDIDWATLANHFVETKNEGTYSKIENYLLSNPASRANRQLILKLSDEAKNDLEVVKKIFTGIMSLPEYQLC